LNLEIIKKPFSLELYGYSGVAASQNYGDTGFKLMNRMWGVVKSNNFPNNGINVWVYEPGDVIFAGVELETRPEPVVGLEKKIILLESYAYYKHIGPYSQLKQAYAAMREELKRRSVVPGHPGLEIYGHWNSDESKLETEILMTIELGR